MDMLFVVDDDVTEEELLKLSKKFSQKSKTQNSEPNTSSFVNKMRPTVLNTGLQPKMNTEENSIKKCKTYLGKQMQKKCMSDMPIVKNGMLRRITRGSPIILTSSDSEDEVECTVVDSSPEGINPLIHSSGVKRRRKCSDSLKQELKKLHTNNCNGFGASGNKLGEVVVDSTLNICDRVNKSGEFCSYISEQLPGSLLEVTLDSDTEKSCTFNSHLKRNAAIVMCDKTEKKRKIDSPEPPAYVKEMGSSFEALIQNISSKDDRPDGCEPSNSYILQPNICDSTLDKRSLFNQMQECSSFPEKPVINGSAETVGVSFNSNTLNINSPLVIQQPTLDIPDWMYVALDCEMVGTGPNGKHSALARCSIVDYSGKVIYDHYIKPAETITDYRTPWSGIRPCHMFKALPCSLALPEIKKFLEKKIIIGHAVYHDFKALDMHPPQFMVRDTARSARLVEMAGLQGKGNSLKKLSAALLGRHIQVGKRGHCSVEDARATLDLFKLVRTVWEPELMAQWTKKDSSISQQLMAIISSCVTSGNVNQLEDFLHDRFWPSL